MGWLETQPGGPVRRLVDRYHVDGRKLLLVNRGSLVNLAADAGVAVDELFDPFAGIVLRGLAWILGGGAMGQGRACSPARRSSSGRSQSWPWRPGRSAPARVAAAPRS